MTYLKSSGKPQRLPARYLGGLAALCASVVLPVGLIGPARAAGPCDAWMDTTKTPDQRAQALLPAMTTDDKIVLLHNAEWMTGQAYGSAGHIPGNAALCLPDLYFNDAGQGVTGIHGGNTTAFPAGISQASSWNPALQRQFGESIGWEAWHKGGNVQLMPSLNIARVPRNGRNWEYMGEDPYLAGQGTAAVVQGVQSQNVIATLKHYAANNQENQRMSISADVDPRTMHEIYLPAFEAGVKQGRAGSVMCSYNKLNVVPPYQNSNSIYACEHPTLLTTYLKGEFGFDGWIMSDWGGTHSTAAAANAGLDQDMNAPSGTFFAAPLKTAVQNGQVSQARFDDMVTRILRTMFRVGLFDNPPVPQPQGDAADVVTPHELEVARNVSREGTVLLKNQGAILPLLGTLQQIALIGKPAAPDGAALVYNGWGSGHVPNNGPKTDVVSPLQAIQQRAVFNNDVVTYTDGSSIQDAVAAATVADIAVVFAYDQEGEGTDRPSLSLNDTTGVCTLLGCNYTSSNQNELIQAVAGANTNTVVVLNTGGPVLMPWVNQVKAVIEAWFPGQEYGNALAPILFGDVNPSGKLPQTFPRAEADLPASTPAQYPGVNGHATYSEGLLVGYRWFDARGIEPLFCFGHGLSYTTFGYSGLTVAAAPNGGATVSFTLKNTGSRSGAEVAQVYVGFPPAAGEPPKQLKGFQKVFVPAGQGVPVTISLDRRAFSYWDSTGGWTVAPGTYHISVGSSSCDIRLQADISVSTTAVTLRSFSASRVGAGSVALRWRTGSEARLLGFNLYRERTRLNKALILARHATGGSYSYADHLSRGTSTRYRLQAVKLDSAWIWLGSATVR
jgi:beta-glucosidase